MKKKVKKETVNERLIKIMICIYCFLCYYEAYINSIFPITKYYVALFVFFLLLFSRKRFTISYYHVAFFLWFLLRIFSLFFSQPFLNTNPYTHGGNFVMMLGLVLLLTALDDMVAYVKYFISYSCFWSFTLCVLAIFFSSPYKKTYTARLVLTLFGIQHDPNNMAALYLFSFAIFVYLLTKRHKWWTICLLGIGCALSLYTITITGSRGGLVTAGLVVLIFIVNILITREKTQLILAMIAASLLPLGIPFIPTNILQRFTAKNQTLEQLSSERTIIWAEAFEKFKQKPFFGYGWGGYHLGAEIESRATHNTVITLVLDNGIVGAALFLYPIIDILIKSILHWRILELIIMVVGFVPALNIDGINKRFWWNSIIIAILLAKKRKMEKPVETVGSLEQEKILEV